MLEFRRATEDELPALRELLLNVARAMSRNGVSPHCGGRPCAELDLGRAHIYKDSGETVGILFMTMPVPCVPDADSVDPDTRYGTVAWMAVGPEYVRQGHGTAMLQIAEGLFMDAGAKRTRLVVPEDNPAMAAFLQKNGYLAAGTADSGTVFEKHWVPQCPCHA